MRVRYELHTGSDLIVFEVGCLGRLTPQEVTIALEFFDRITSMNGNGSGMPVANAIKGMAPSSGEPSSR